MPQLALLAPGLPLSLQYVLWWAMALSFAVKMPMWPVHTWLPDAHVQAPTSGSVILAGVLLKLGGYGFLRFSLPMLPEASLHFSPIIFALSAVAILYGSLVALVQTDMKKMIAYSSIAHMGIVTIGLFIGSLESVQGALMQMISHGIVSGALFLCVGVLYDRLHTRAIADYGGVVTVMPHFALFFLLFTLASIGLPGTSGFVGEFLVIMGSFVEHPMIAALAATGMVLGALYMLSLYRSTMFGAPSARVTGLKDLRWREYSVLLPLSGCVLLFGIMPSLLTRYTDGPVRQLLAHTNISIQMYGAQRIEPKASTEHTPEATPKPTMLPLSAAPTPPSEQTAPILEQALLNHSAPSQSQAPDRPQEQEEPATSHPIES